MTRYSRHVAAIYTGSRALGKRERAKDSSRTCRTGGITAKPSPSDLCYPGLMPKRGFPTDSNRPVIGETRFPQEFFPHLWSL